MMQDCNGWTALHSACNALHNDEIVKLLAEVGGIELVEKRESGGQTAAETQCNEGLYKDLIAQTLK